MDTSNKIEVSYPVCFRKSDLARAIKNKTGTSFFYGKDGRINYTELRDHLFTYKKLIDSLGWDKEDYKNLSKFDGPIAEEIARHLKLSSKYF